MTNLAPENVTTRAAPGAITLYKFVFLHYLCYAFQIVLIPNSLFSGEFTLNTVDTQNSDPCTTDVAASRIFVTNAETKNAKDQNATCAAENGRPLVIKTVEQLQAAQVAVKYNGVSLFTQGSCAWLTATLTSDKVLQWPDKTNVTQCLKTPDIVMNPTNQLYSLLSENGKFVGIWSPAFKEFPVLCYK
ncbi:uncharacterized protein LOC108678963 [Hyalella azteca]|uniref:Uncharacterized protein LOC108678963 n=1 Tax=Hyalella azteca TaxID=294128 RepID=A0A8B7P9X2_HYAAZ|nr:uncharacterized protein LOC108678963 [Hyalella azteca]